MQSPAPHTARPSTARSVASTRSQPSASSASGDWRSHACGAAPVVHTVTSAFSRRPSDSTTSLAATRATEVPTCMTIPCSFSSRSTRSTAWSSQPWSGRGAASTRTTSATHLAAMIRACSAKAISMPPIPAPTTQHDTVRRLPSATSASTRATRADHSSAGRVRNACSVTPGVSSPATLAPTSRESTSAVTSPFVVITAPPCADASTRVTLASMNSAPAARQRGPSSIDSSCALMRPRRCAGIRPE